MKVLCSCSMCDWWKPLDKPRKLKMGKFNESLSEYTGECDRVEGEIGIQMSTFENLDLKLKNPICYGYADKIVSGHLNFSKLPQGGQLPDPVTPDAAFH